MASFAIYSSVNIQVSSHN